MTRSWRARSRLSVRPVGGLVSGLVSGSVGGRRSSPRLAGSGLDVDRSVPALAFKVGQYPVHSGGVGVIRTLGRLGVPVYAITEPGLTPAGVSRYCSGRLVWRATGLERQDQLVVDLREVGRRIGRPSVIVPVDDEAAVLVAEHAAELSEYFLAPAVRPGLPRQLASKSGLFQLCRQQGVAAPATVTPASVDEVAAFAATASFPVVVKNAETWDRRRNPVVPGTTVLRSAEELLALVGSAGAAGETDQGGCGADGAGRARVGDARTGGAGGVGGDGGDAWVGGARVGGGVRAPGVIVQEYLPPDQAQDWIVQLYCDADSNCAVLFTGRKVRSWPPHTGVTACGYSMPNPELAAIAERFCLQIGFRGIADLDWRLDLRDGQYKLVDFNPRSGNQFRLFETDAGVDVVRAMHLDLTGRTVPPGPQVQGRRIIIEHVDLPARLAYRRIRRRAQPDRPALLGQRSGLVAAGGLTAGRSSAAAGESVVAGRSARRSAVAGRSVAAGRSPVAQRRSRSTELAWLAADDPLPFLAMLCRVAGPAVTGLARMLRPPASRTPTT